MGVLLLVDLHNWVLHSATVLSVRAVTRAWSLRLPRNLATFMHESQDLLVVGRIIH